MPNARLVTNKSQFYKSSVLLDLEPELGNLLRSTDAATAPSGSAGRLVVPLWVLVTNHGAVPGARDA